MPNYDLEERTAKFGEEIIRFAKKIPINPITVSLITQLIKALQALEPITAKQMMLAQGKILSINYLSLRKSQGKANIGYA